MGHFKRSLIPTAAMAALVMLTASASAAPSSDDARALRYELRAMGTRAGQAVLYIGAPTTAGKTKVRPMRVEAKTEGIAARFLNLTTVSTTWVNAHWLPVRARWDSLSASVKRVVKTIFTNKKVAGTDHRDGKLFRRTNHLTNTPAADIISVFPWLMQQDMTQGTVYQIPVFDGRRMYELTVTVGGEKDVQLEVGRRRVIELSAVVRRGDVYKRKMTLLISAGADRTPYKLTFKYGLLGSVEAIFKGQKRIASR